MIGAAAAIGAPVRQRVHWSERIAHVVLIVVALALLAFLAAPLAAILQQSLEDAQGRFAGVSNFVAYAQTPALLESLWNSVWVSVVVTVVTVPTAFGFAYALTRSRMRFKGLARTITLVPLLAPSLLAAISLIYWFGNQGVLKAWLHGLRHRPDLRRPGHRAGRNLLDVPARADDPDHRAHRCRRTPVRGRRLDGHDARRASSSRSRCPARSTV